MSVYLIEAENGLVKIGEAISPGYRLSCLALCSPVQLRLAAILRDCREGELHERFRKYRRHNEWFLKEGELRLFFNQHFGAGLDGPVADWITDWDKYRNSQSDKKRERQRLAWRRRLEASAA